MPNPAATSVASVAAIGSNLNRVVHQVARLKAAIQAAKGNDVDYLPNLLLFHLVASGPMRASALAEHTDVDPSTVSRQVERLVRTGVIERRPDPDDGRACLLAPTDVGLDRHAWHVARRTAAFDRMLADWSEVDRSRFAELLERFSDDFDNYKHVMIDDLTGTPPENGDAREEHT